MNRFWAAIVQLIKHAFVINVKTHAQEYVELMLIVRLWIMYQLVFAVTDT